MRGLLLLGIGAFATGAAVAVAQQRRTNVDEDFGEDPSWPSVPYTRETHPDSPQEQVTAAVEETPASPAPANPATAAEGGAAAKSSDGSGSGSTTTA